MRALSAFKEEYGSYPNEDTLTEVLKRHPEAKGLLGKTSSNEFFRQMIVAGYVDGEGPFSMEHRRSDDLVKIGHQGGCSRQVNVRSVMWCGNRADLQGWG